MVMIRLIITLLSQLITFMQAGTTVRPETVLWNRAYRSRYEFRHFTILILQPEITGDLNDVARNKNNKQNPVF